MDAVQHPAALGAGRLAIDPAGAATAVVVHDAPPEDPAGVDLAVVRTEAREVGLLGLQQLQCAGFGIQGLDPTLAGGQQAPAGPHRRGADLHGQPALLAAAARRLEPVQPAPLDIEPVQSAPPLIPERPLPQDASARGDAYDFVHSSAPVRAKLSHMRQKVRNARRLVGFHSSRLAIIY